MVWHHGIDQVAHKACIENKGKTIAIIGSGFNIVKNRKIFSSILKNDGLILSEYMPDTPAFKYNFPRRNSLIVALCNGVIAVEVHENSGTMITAKEALKQTVPLFTFPGDVFNSRYFGNNFLLTKGAYCITSYLDVLNILTPEKLNAITTPQESEETILNINPEYKKIYSALSKKPQSINNLAKILNLSITELQATLTMMELDDLVIKMSNSKYASNANFKKSH